ncbi:MAG: arsenate reductase ArsC [Candidatus Kariarchaeaceae archaeon]|jgi:arsenate reductase
MKNVLFVCTHNSSRSQIAEGLVNFYAEDFQAFSAGTEVTEVNPYAIAVLSEIGADITNHRSKSIDEFMDSKFDFVVTVCDNAKETCPFFPNADQYLHMGFPDPSAVEGTDDDKLNAFRNTRSQIANWLFTRFGLQIIINM